MDLIPRVFDEPSGSFYLYGPDGFWAIEVKRSAKVQRSDLRHLRTFAEDYPESCVVLLHMGEERLLIDDIWCLPCEEFLRDLTPSADLVP